MADMRRGVPDRAGARGISLRAHDGCSQNPEDMFVTRVRRRARPADRGASLRQCRAYRAHDRGRRRQGAGDGPRDRLGTYEDAKVQDETRWLPSDQKPALYTDGQAEAIDPANEFFGTRRPAEALRDVAASTASANEVLSHVRSRLDALRDDCEPFDDIAVLVLCLDGEGLQARAVAAPRTSCPRPPTACCRARGGGCGDGSA